MASNSGTRSLMTLALVFAAGLGGGAGAVYFLAAPARQDLGAESAGEGGPVVRVAARGRLEPAGGVVNLAASGPDIVAKLLVRDGAEVTADQELAILASRDLRQIEVEAARTQLAEAEERKKQTLAYLRAQQKEADTRIRALEAQGPLDIDLQQAKITVLQRQFATAESLVTRMRRAGSYPQQEIDQQELVRVQAEQELAAARGGLQKIKDAQAANLEAAKAQREAGEAGIKRAEAEAQTGTLAKGIALAGEKLELTAIRSPIAGKVLKVMAREGEMVGAQPVFQVADTRVMVAVAEVYETDVKTVRDWFRTGKRVDADVELRFLGGGAKYRGRVISIGSVTAKNAVFSLDPRQDADRRVIEVRVQLDDAHHQEAAEFINMTVDVTIHAPK